MRLSIFYTPQYFGPDTNEFSLNQDFLLDFKQKNYEQARC